ncbi:MAG: LysM peptidoglycan-binding domain-containing M23 family metallopeptidase [Chloroflexota bacterium]|nr:LysM peptidoglycan-binding domain-containing M23 family metallopeptidase [Chloroflexota bacterium]
MRGRPARSRRPPAGPARRWLLLLGAVCLLAGCYRPAPELDSIERRELTRGEASSPSARATAAPSAASPAAPTAVPSPSPAYSGTYSGTPTPDPTPDGHGEGGGVETYTVRAGETLSLIASVYGCSVVEIVLANNLSSADAVQAGQILRIPTMATRTGPTLKLVPDGEMVYGPATVDFDLEGFVAGQDGYLATYTDQVEGQVRTGAEIVQLVAQRFSVGPRVLLALLEFQSGWVTQAQPAGGTLVYPMGHVEGYQEGLFNQLSWAAVRLNEAYYGWKRGDWKTVRLLDGTRIGLAPGLNAGTAGVQNCLARVSANEGEWRARVGEGGFLATYTVLFGNPFAYTVDPLVPHDLEQPEMRLPWPSGETWYLTGGPHGGWADGSGMAALDFVPAGRLGCAPAPDWSTAAAPGLVVRSENGEVVIDLDGDGFEQTGWTFLYLHIYTEGRVEAGAWVEQGERIGHPSCEGGFADATHLHFARRYNGEWIPAGAGACPMVLSGWTPHEAEMPYDGTVTRGNQERVAAECWDDDLNGLTSDNPLP